MKSEKELNKKVILLGVIIGGTFLFFIINLLIHIGQEGIQAIQAISETPDDVSFKIDWMHLFVFQSDLIELYFVVYLLLGILLLKLLRDFKMNYASLNKGQHGTSEFEDPKELKNQYKVIPSKTDEYDGSGGVIIAGLQEPMKPYKLLIDDSPVHTMCIGITRSGKGETFVFPMIDVLSRAKEKPSLVVNDPKGELVGASYHTLIERGYDVQVFNLLDQHMGMGFNPLQLVVDAWKKGDVSLAQQYANSIAFSLYHNPNAKEPMWDESAASLVTAIILGLTEDAVRTGKEEKVNMYSVASFLSNKGSDNEVVGQEEVNALDEYFKARDELNPATLAYSTSNFASGNTRASIFTTAMSKLQIFMLEPNAKLTSYNSFNLTDIGFGDKPIALFMVVPDFDSSNHILASILVSQLYRVNAERATRSSSGKMNRHIHFMLDEFGNMPAVDGMPAMVTVGAGRGFRFHLIIQSYSQIKKLYGEDSDTIIGNCSNQIYILTNDEATAKHYSSLIGTTTISDVSRSGKLFSSDKSHSETVKERPLLTQSELMTLKLGTSVVVRVNKREDNKRRKIIPKPIYNKDLTSHKFRWEYLSDDFDNSNSVINLPIMSTKYHDIDLTNIVFSSRSSEDIHLRMTYIMMADEFELLVKGLKSITKQVKDINFPYEIEVENWSFLHLYSYLYNEIGHPRVFEAFSKNLQEHVADDVMKIWRESFKNKRNNNSEEGDKEPSENDSGVKERIKRKNIV